MEGLSSGRRFSVQVSIVCVWVRSEVWAGLGCVENEWMAILSLHDMYKSYNKCLPFCSEEVSSKNLVLKKLISQELVLKVPKKKPSDRIT